MKHIESFGNGCNITLGDDGIVTIAHDCDCGGGKPCCLTAVDGVMFRDAMIRLTGRIGGK